MGIKINCKYNDRGAWCTNEKIKRSLFGFGARCCTLFPCLNGVVCEYQMKYKRPDPPPPPPPRKDYHAKILVIQK